MSETSAQALDTQALESAVETTVAIAPPQRLATLRRS
jgi:hypothetical protein